MCKSFFFYIRENSLCHPVGHQKSSNQGAQGQRDTVITRHNHPLSNLGYSRRWHLTNLLHFFFSVFCFTAIAIQFFFYPSYLFLLMTSSERVLIGIFTLPLCLKSATINPIPNKPGSVESKVVTSKATGLTLEPLYCAQA